MTNLPRPIYRGVFGEYEGLAHNLPAMVKDLTNAGVDLIAWAQAIIAPNDMDDDIAGNLRDSRAGSLGLLMPKEPDSTIMDVLHLAASDRLQTPGQASLVIRSIPFITDDDFVEWEITEWILDACPGTVWGEFRPDEYGSTEICVWSLESLGSLAGLACDRTHLDAVINRSR
jgi:hypothetical protein